MSEDFYLGALIGVIGLAIVLLLGWKLFTRVKKPYRSPLKNWDVGCFVIEFHKTGGYERYGTLGDAIRFKLAGPDRTQINDQEAAMAKVLAEVANQLAPDQQLALASRLSIAPYMLSPGVVGYQS